MGVSIGAVVALIGLVMMIRVVGRDRQRGEGNGGSAGPGFVLFVLGVVILAAYLHHSSGR